MEKTWKMESILSEKGEVLEEAEPSQMLCLKAFRCFSHIFEKMRFEPKRDPEMAPKSIENRPRGTPWDHFWSFSKALRGVRNHMIFENDLGSRKGRPKWDSGSLTVSRPSWRHKKASSFAMYLGIKVISTTLYIYNINTPLRAR